MMKRVDILPVGAVQARAIPFHQLFDAEFLNSHGDETKFFMNSTSFCFPPSPGMHKLCVETNLFGSGQSLPAGQMKEVQWISILVEGAEDEEFEVGLLLCRAPFGRWKVQNGSARAVRAEREPKEGGGRGPYCRLIALEQFCVEVRAPEEFRGRYARLSLHGPLVQAL